jgi:hypothetical protein
MGNWISTGLAGFVFAAATSAQASIISVDLGLEGPIEDGSAAIDLFGDVTLTVDGGYVLGGPDGRPDMELADRTIDDVNIGTTQVFLGRFDFEGPLLLPSLDDELGLSRITALSFATSGAFMASFGAGENIEDHAGDWTPFGTFYEGSDGPLSTEGDRGIFGFKVEYISLSSVLTGPELDFCIEIDYDSAECIDALETPPIETLLATFYGYLDITRGSIGVNTVALNTVGSTPGSPTSTPAPAVAVSPVPLPASSWLMLAAFGGLVAAKRRKS